MLETLTKALLDEDTGLFGVRQTRIGQVLFRSTIYSTCLLIAGVTAIHNLAVYLSAGDGFQPATSYRIDAGEGNYFSLAGDDLVLILGGAAMSTAIDNYAVYYAGKMWALLPEVYRAEDSDSPDTKGPLRELVDRLGAEAAILRRSIDRLWDDAFVETCDDWVISYLAGLLQTNLVPGLNSRGQRIDVAKTIYYRRRNGTLPLLEEVAADITGWEAKVVEFFRRLGRHRHGLDPAIGVAASGNRPDPLQQAQGIVGRLSGTPMGGFADLRNRYAASRTGTAFEEYHYTADLRNGRGQRGWYNIPRLGVFVWRRKSYPLDLTTPVPVDGCTDWYTRSNRPGLAALLRGLQARGKGLWHPGRGVANAWAYGRATLAVVLRSALSGFAARAAFGRSLQNRGSIGAGVGATWGASASNMAGTRPLPCREWPVPGCLSLLFLVGDWRRWLR